MRLMIPFVLFLIIVVIFANNFFSRFISRTAFFSLGALLFGIGSILMFFVWTITSRRWQAKKYIFDNKHVHIIDSAFGATHETYNLSGVTSVKITQSFFDKLCNCGTISMTFFGGGRVDLVNIPTPEDELIIIQDLIENSKS